MQGVLACLSITYRVSLLICILSNFLLSPGNGGRLVLLPPGLVEIYDFFFLQRLTGHKNAAELSTSRFDFDPDTTRAKSPIAQSTQSEGRERESEQKSEAKRERRCGWRGLQKVRLHCVHA